MLLHTVQEAILRKFEVLGKASFNALKPEHIDPKLFVYHLQKLVSQQIIEKVSTGEYQLTQFGKHAWSSYKATGGLADAANNTYLLLRLEYEGKILAVTRKQVPFLGYTGVLSLGMSKEISLLEHAQQYVRSIGLLTSPLALSLILDVLYRNLETKEVIQHSIMFVISGKLHAAPTQLHIDEGTLSLLTPEELRTVTPGYSNTTDLLVLPQQLTYVTREYFDEL